MTGGEHGRWTALSYCWGENSSFLLNSHNIRQFHHGAYSLEDYPPTLKDAIRLTRNLGIPYLWVDALCILQDSASDWAIEASRMKSVYERAKITIAAASSSNVQGAFFGSMPLSTKCVSSNGDRLFLLLAPGSVCASVLQASDHNKTPEPPDTRGWVLQESLLPSRTLTYA